MHGVQVPAKGHTVTVFRGKMWRGKGGLYPDYVDRAGKSIPWPGGQWHEGREGRWVDLGVLDQKVQKFRRWHWLYLRIRMEWQEIKVFVLSIIRRKLQ